MTNSTGQARGRQGWRRTIVLITCLSVFGVAALGSAGPASAGFTLCNATLTPKSKAKPGKTAKLAFTCNTELRAYGIVSNKSIASYTSPPAVGGNQTNYFFLECEGGVPAAGFGCGIRDRNAPANCGQSTTVLPAVKDGPPAVNQITGPPCIQVIPKEIVVSQDVTLKRSPCTFKPKEKLQMFLIAGGEPPISSFTPRGDSVTVGEYTTEPFRVKVKGYAGCQPSPAGGAKPEPTAKAKKQATARPAGIGQDLFPMGCSGDVKPKNPANPGIDAIYEFSCVQNIRAYTITANKPLDFFGVESEVTQPNGVASGTESALIQCEGPIPSFGFGCGITNRQTATNRLSAGNKLKAELGLPVSPCKRQRGEAKLKVWLTVMGEPAIPAMFRAPSSTGEYVSEPFPLVIDGYGKGDCVLPKPKSGK